MIYIYIYIFISMLSCYFLYFIFWLCRRILSKGDGLISTCGRCLPASLKHTHVRIYTPSILFTHIIYLHTYYYYLHQSQAFLSQPFSKASHVHHYFPHHALASNSAPRVFIVFDHPTVQTVGLFRPSFLPRNRLPNLLLQKPAPPLGLVHRPVVHLAVTDHRREPPGGTASHHCDGEPGKCGVHSQDQLLQLPQGQAPHRVPRRLARVRHIQR